MSARRRCFVVCVLDPNDEVAALTNFCFWATNARAAALKAARRPRVKNVALYEHGSEFETPRVRVFSREKQLVKTSPNAPTWVTRPEHEVFVVKRERVVELRAKSQ